MPHPLMPTDPPISKDEAQASFIGEIPQLQGKIEVTPYNPDWPAQFEGEAAAIRRILGDRILELEHIGSTSVPGLPAKPILDIDLVVLDSTDEEAYLPALEAAGYQLTIREPHWHEHRMLKRSDPSVNLHIWTLGSPESARHKIFRDWLRTNEADRRAYGRHKQALAEQDFRYMHEYNNAKSVLIREILARALDALPID
jgi:GrpB-like predicted nucleotidyltransferase (UPF0157 family)